MHSSHDKSAKEQPVPAAHTQLKHDKTAPTFQFQDNRSQAVAQRRLQEAMQNGPQSAENIQRQSAADVTAEQQPPVQKKENNTGLPDNLKSGVENLSGIAMDDVKVHYNSAKPAQMQAHAYAQGTNIHVAPGQEKHLPHEAWHVVQQKQGRVKPSVQLAGGTNVNDDQSLEHEATQMGQKATQLKSKQLETGGLTNKSAAPNVIQGWFWEYKNGKYIWHSEPTFFGKWKKRLGPDGQQEMHSEGKQYKRGVWESESPTPKKVTSSSPPKTNGAKITKPTDTSIPDPPKKPPTPSPEKTVSAPPVALPIHGPGLPDTIRMKNIGSVDDIKAFIDMADELKDTYFTEFSIYEKVLQAILPGDDLYGRVANLSGIINTNKYLVNTIKDFSTLANRYRKYLKTSYSWNNRGLAQELINAGDRHYVEIQKLPAIIKDYYRSISVTLKHPVGGSLSTELRTRAEQQKKSFTYTGTVMIAPAVEKEIKKQGLWDKFEKCINDLATTGTTGRFRAIRGNYDFMLSGDYRAVVDIKFKEFQPNQNIDIIQLDTHEGKGPHPNRHKVAAVGSPSKKLKVAQLHGTITALS